MLISQGSDNMACSRVSERVLDYDGKSLLMSWFNWSFGYAISGIVSSLIFGNGFYFTETMRVCWRWKFTAYGTLIT